MSETQEIADWKAALVPRKHENQTMRHIRWAGSAICNAIKHLPADSDPQFACRTGLYHLANAYKTQTGETDG